ncbi:hypothetical protein [Methylobacterium sp. Leaf89]|uniref:hypothetical protein n=1 Tax=Methylobacterium sp. Leaf89 TaxID=1736245 RepID=UPI000AED5EDF|nr:hypothetical protein [Methylobacterium sp. Leaf89]
MSSQRHYSAFAKKPVAGTVFDFHVAATEICDEEPILSIGWSACFHPATSAGPRMPALPNELELWRERNSLSVRETAAVFRRSTSWVRDRITDRSLAVLHSPIRSPTEVTVSSIAALIDRLGPERVQISPPRRRGAYLRLIVDNTAS